MRVVWPDTLPVYQLPPTVLIHTSSPGCVIKWGVIKIFGGFACTKVQGDIHGTNIPMAHRGRVVVAHSTCPRCRRRPTSLARAGLQGGVSAMRGGRWHVASWQLSLD